MKRVKKLAMGIFLLSHAIAGGAYAASITQHGTTVDFTYDDNLMNLFGQPTVVGNTLFFVPPTPYPNSFFGSSSSNGEGYTFNKASVNIKVTAHTGIVFDSVNVLERGDYLLLGAGSTAYVSGQVRVFDPAKPLTDLTAGIMATSPLTMSGPQTNDWTANSMIDVSNWNTARTLNVTLENILLTSTSTPNSLALVEKKFASLSFVTTPPIPEAETYGMMLAGLGLIGFVVSRRRRS